MYPGKKTGNWYTWDASGNVAASNGYLSLIKDREASLNFIPYDMDCVAERGHLEIVKWLHFNRTEGCTTKAMDCAAEKGHLEVVKCLKENVPMFKN